MARKAVVAVFKTQNDAYDTAEDIKKLDMQDGGMLHVRQAAFITKDLKGNVSVPETEGNEVPWGTLGGPIVGGLLGLIAGPAGAAVGGATGLFMGWGADMMHLGISEDYVESVSSEVDPGDSALVAEIEEGSTEPLDKLVASHHGRILRAKSGPDARLRGTSLAELPSGAPPGHFHGT
jgi:uncharacterized membrane protein